MFTFLITGGRDFGNLYTKTGIGVINNSTGAIYKKWRYVKKSGKALEKAIKERQFIYDKLDESIVNDKHNLLISTIYDYIRLAVGDAKGVDSHALDWAMVNKIKNKQYEANWKKYGNAACPIRNQEMLDTEIKLLTDQGFDPVTNMAVIAFPGGKGTRDMINRSKKENIKVIEWEYIED